VAETPESSSAQGLIRRLTAVGDAVCRRGVQRHHLQKESHTAGINGLAPTPNTRVFVGRRPLFRTGHVLSTARNGATPTPGVWSTTLQEGANRSLGSVYRPARQPLHQIQPNPVLRAQLVQTEPLRPGLPPSDACVAPELPRPPPRTSPVARRRLVDASFFCSDLRRLDTVRVSGGDDFDLNPTVETTRLEPESRPPPDPLTSFNAGLTNQERSAVRLNLIHLLCVFSVGLGTCLTPHLCQRAVAARQPRVRPGPTTTPPSRVSSPTGSDPCTKPSPRLGAASPFQPNPDPTFAIQQQAPSAGTLPIVYGAA
jgi:hypothetical protein